MYEQIVAAIQGAAKFVLAFFSEEKSWIVFYWDSKIFRVSVYLIASNIYCKIANFIEILLSEV